MSEQGLGPQYCGGVAGKYRIESFFHSRPLSIWELRNPVFVKIYMQKLVAFNFNKGAIARLKEKYPINKDKLSLDQIIKEWGPAVKKRLPSFRGKLLQDNGIEHPASLKLIDAFDKTFLFKGYEEYFSSLVPRDSMIVLAHNDAQENNALINLDDNLDMMFIDVEYSGWNPIAYDLANYFNECVCDNTNVKYYTVNYPL